jgi:hypothetical protein
MVAYTDSLGFNKGVAAYPDGSPVFKFEVVLDFAAIAAARAAVGAAALASGDTLEIIPIPAGSTVLHVGADVTKAEGATATMDVGDASSATTYLSNVNLNSVAKTGATVAAPVFYGSADELLITLDNNSIDAAVVRVWAIVADCN